MMLAGIFVNFSACSKMWDFTDPVNNYFYLPIHLLGERTPLARFHLESNTKLTTSENVKCKAQKVLSKIQISLFAVKEMGESKKRRSQAKNWCMLKWCQGPKTDAAMQQVGLSLY
jgi:hypothetical protein